LIASPGSPLADFLDGQVIRPLRRQTKHPPPPDVKAGRIATLGALTDRGFAA
jgi:hypothetical protein